MSKRIYAGEIHYTRIPVEYWEHRIKMVKAMESVDLPFSDLVNDV